MGVMGVTLVPKIVIYIKNKDVCKKMSSKRWQLLTKLRPFENKSEFRKNICAEYKHPNCARTLHICAYKIQIFFLNIHKSVNFHPFELIFFANILIFVVDYNFRGQSITHDTHITNLNTHGRFIYHP